MLPVFLALVVFSTPAATRIVAVYPTLDDCLVASSQRNKAADSPWAKEITSGYVCLVMRAPV